VEKYGTARQATQDNIARAHCMLDTSNYKHAIKIFNDYCFCSVTTVDERASMFRYTSIACLGK
jgi:predicted DNA-binding protein YlxM (UPF0122 family)